MCYKVGWRDALRRDDLTYGSTLRCLNFVYKVTSVDGQPLSGTIHLLSVLHAWQSEELRIYCSCKVEEVLKEIIWSKK